MDEYVDEITYTDLGLCRDDFVKELYGYSDENKGLLKVLNFWKDNDGVHIPLIEKSYMKYLDFQPYYPYNTLDFIKLKSKKAFKIVHEDTGEILGTFKEFSLDAPFKIIDTENGEFKITDEQLKDLLEGKYDFMII